MSLKDRITEDMKTAMRAKEADRLLTIRMLLAACKQREVDERIVLDDAAVVGIVDKLIKQRKDSITAFQQAGRTDLVDKEAAELRVLEAYLPQRLSAEEVQAAVAALVAELAASGPGDMGKVMGAAKARLAGSADMGLVSAAVKQALGEVIAMESNDLLPLRAVAPDVCVAPQLTPEAMAEAARQGFKSVVNNRPDFEHGPDQPTNASIEAAAHAAGLQYRFLPVDGGYQSPEEITAMARLLAELPRPVLAFCRSGARSARLLSAARAL